MSPRITTEMPATPRQIKELMGHLSRSLPDRLKWMPASQMQRLISNPQSLILEPITTRLQESFEVFQAQILALRQNISAGGSRALWVRLTAHQGRHH